MKTRQNSEYMPRDLAFKASPSSRIAPVPVIDACLRRPLHCLLLLCLGITGRVWADTSLATYGFETPASISGWIVSGANAGITQVGNDDILPVQEGRNCLQFVMTGTDTGARYIRNQSLIPVAVATTPPVPRRIHVSLGIRSEALAAGDLVIRVLEQTDDGVSHWVMDRENFLEVPASRQWVQFEKIAWLRDDTTRLFVYVYVMDGTNANGVVWLDNVSVTALDANDDYLVEASSGQTGNVFEADNGMMTVELYDPRTASINVSVLDHAGSAASSTQATVTALTSKKLQVGFLEKGHYTVQATITPAGGSPVVKTWTAAIIGSPVATVSPFGVFSVNSDNPLAEAAGSRWNRYFIHFRNVISSGTTFRYTGSSNNARSEWLSGSSSFTNSMLYLPESVDQEWIACLDGIPDELLPTGKDSTNRKQWEYFNDRAQFKAMLKWVLTDLPSFVHYVETGNELEWGNWGGTWAQLGDYIKAIREVVDDVNAEDVGRDLKLIGPVFAHLSTPAYPDPDTSPDSSYGFANKYLMLDDLLRVQNVVASLDGISMHAYGNGSAPEDQFLTRLDGFRDYLVSIGAGSLPVYFTEFGWQSGNPGDWQPAVSETDHANYTARAWLLLLSRADDYQIEAAQSFCLRHLSGGGLDHYSFLNPDFTPRLPFASYARAAREVAACTGQRRYLYLGADLRVFTATGSGRTLLALWTKTGATRVTNLPDAATAARDLYGHPVDIGTSGKQVSATGAPVFVTVTGEALGAYVNGPSYTVTRGSTEPVEFAEMIAPPGFSLSGSGLSVPIMFDTGSCRILGRVGAIWKLYAITVD